MQRASGLPRVPVEAVTLLAFAALAFFEIHVGHYADFLLGFIMAILLGLSWAYRDSR